MRQLRTWARMVNAAAVTIPTSRAYSRAIPMVGNGPMMIGGTVGRWSTDRRDHRSALQFAASEHPPRDPRRLLLWLARKAIEAIHRELASRDLFGHHDPDNVTVAVTMMDRETITGTSSTYGDWHPIDHFEARALRTTIMRKYPHLARQNSGQIPLDAFFPCRDQPFVASRTQEWQVSRRERSGRIRGQRDLSQLSRYSGPGRPGVRQSDIDVHQQHNGSHIGSCTRRKVAPAMKKITSSAAIEGPWITRPEMAGAIFPYACRAAPSLRRPQ